MKTHEERLSPPQALSVYESDGYLDPSRITYSCPGDRMLDVSFHMTPQHMSLAGLWLRIPQFLFYSFAFSFLGVCIFIGIFRPRKQMPTDPMQAIEFAQSKGKARQEGRTGVTLADVGGLGPVSEELNNVVDVSWGDGSCCIIVAM